MYLNKILVVVDPTTDIQPACERALESARMTGASLHLYAGVDASSGCNDLAEAQRALEPILYTLSKRADAQKLAVETELEFTGDWRAAAVTAAARCGASMVFKSSHDHSTVDREKRHTADWNLLRHSPCPVLMVKNFRDWNHRKVLAAINPATTESCHIKLNNQIVSFARRFAQAYGSDAHFVTAFQNLNHTPQAGAIANDCGVGEEQVHVCQGKPAEVIRDMAAALDADLIIIGTIGRDGIKGSVVGNTSERLLDQTQSDLLVLN